MSVSCKVILDPIEVNKYLMGYGYAAEHPVRDGKVEPPAEGISVIERNEVHTALLGRHAHGIANVVLMGEDGPLIVSLALLEHIVEAMRDVVGPDPRLVSTGEDEYTPPDDTAEHDIVENDNVLDDPQEELLGIAVKLRALFDHRGVLVSGPHGAEAMEHLTEIDRELAAFIADDEDEEGSDEHDA